MGLAQHAAQGGVGKAGDFPLQLVHPPPQKRSEANFQGLLFHPPEQLSAYGFKCPDNGTKNFLMCLQAYLLKQLLFDQKGGSKAGSMRCVRRNIEVILAV